MIFTGLKDENGNIIPVQGAGTEFDEKNNAIKHGTSLVSSGYNQVIHGRHNTPNADMVEIFGGGYGPNTFEVTVKPWFNDTLGPEDFPQPPGDHQDVVIKPSIIVVQKIDPPKYYADPDDDIYIVLEVIQKAEYDFSKLPSQYGDFNNENFGEYEVGDILFIGEAGGGRYVPEKYISVVLSTYYYKDGKIYFYNGEEFTGRSHNRGGERAERFLYGWRYATSMTSIGIGNDNIRTLDWLGNETIKGTFTAGKDVVCKDFLGNPVSLLNLHDDFGRLTGTILVELDTSGGSIDAYHEGDSFEAIFADTLLNKTFKVRVRLHNLDVDEYIIVDAYRYNDGNKKVVDIYCGNRIIRIVTNQDNSIDIDPIELDNIFSTNS